MDYQNVSLFHVNNTQHLLNYITLAGNDNNRTGSDIQINLDLWRVKIGEQIDKI